MTSLCKSNEGRPNVGLKAKGKVKSANCTMVIAHAWKVRRGSRVQSDHRLMFYAWVGLGGTDGRGNKGI